MYRNKKDVDKHVDTLLKKLSSKEFKSRAYSIARLYYDVGDYSNCMKYVDEYLTQKEKNAAAYKLLGQASLKLGQKDKALDHFITSLEIDPTQRSLFLDICELLADNQVEIDIAQATYWCDKALAVFPRHPAIFRLRERLVSLNKSDPEAVVQLLKTQLKENPKDAFLHARLLKHYLNSNQVKEAFEHGYNVEFESNNFNNNIAWYESLIGILKQNTHNIKDWKYQLFLLTVRERICYLSITETPSGTSKSIVESNELLHLYDQAIDSVFKAGPTTGHGEFHLNLIQHHKGQLAFHSATYLLKKAKKEQLNWREATKLAAPFFLISWQTVPIDPKVNWFSHAPEQQKASVLRWHLEGSYRCSQSGHYLISNFKDKSQSFLDNIAQLCSDTNWRDKLYGRIFTGKENLSMSKSSFLVSNRFNPPVIRLPKKNEVMTYDLDAQKFYANSIHHIVWILLNYTEFSKFQCSLFQMLKLSTSNQGPESLNKLDVDAFLYCTALTANQNKSTSPHISHDKPITLPANITELLCTLPQMKWWVIALKFAQNELGTDWTDVRTTLGRGIEVIRCMDNHGLDPELLCKLGHIFSERAKCLTIASEQSDLEARAAIYYKEAILILEKFKNKNFVKVPEKRMFDYTHKDLSEKEITLLLHKAKICVALNYLNDSEYEKSIEMLSNLKTPQAYQIIAKSYLNLSMEKNSLVQSRLSLLTEAKSYADKALSKLKDTEDSNLCGDVHELIEAIEIQMIKTNEDLSENNINELEGENSPDELYYSVNSSRRHVYTMHRNHSSTPKQNNYANNTKYRTAIDSDFSESKNDYQFLERIENQIKNLQRREQTINDFMDQTRDWFDENRKLGNQIMNSVQSNMQNTTDQFKLLKISIDKIKDQLDECKNECKDVNDLKKQLTELRKEVNKLKKSSSDQTIDDSDIYNLEEDYRNTENNLNLPFNPTQVMPSFNQRLLPTFPIPPNPYQMYGQNMINLYNQYSQFAQPPPVPAAPQVFDPSRNPVNYAGIYPTPEQLYLDVAHLVPPPVPPPNSVPIIPTIAPVSILPPVITTTPLPKAAPPAPATTISKSMIESREINRSLPVNVVITSSDPLPTRITTAPAPVLSVTIPPKHIKGTPHNYQIAMPSSDEIGISTSLFSSPAVVKSTATTASATINWNPVNIFQTNQTIPTDTFSNNTQFNLKQLNDSVVDGTSSLNTSLNKSRTLSEKSNTSVENYDPCPDFKPIVPLPAEVKVTTGEEEETVIFSARAKLFRFVNKEWKERGLGNMKLLKHKISGKVRVLMRREQIHKICANHIITPDMEIKPMSNEVKAYFWVANDFADEAVVLEKFCVRFKTPEIALNFYNEFEQARKQSSNVPQSTLVSKKISATSNTEITDIKNDSKVNASSGFKFNTSTEVKNTLDQNNEAVTVKPVVGGFTFNSTPTFKPGMNDNKINKELQPETSSANKLNVFDNLSFKTNNQSQSPFSDLFNKSATQNSPQVAVSFKPNTSDTVEEFEPSVDFKPVVPLPALIDQRTGEEDEIILFEHRAKLLRFDNKEWKERGLGNIKLLMQKDNSQKIRLLMRREQIMKVCCNHVLTKDMVFQKMPQMDKAVTWCAKDFSEGELVAETFCLRFKTVQACEEFIDALKLAQSKLKDESKTAKEVKNAAKQSNQTGFGDKFKPKAGSWHCDSCYTNNLESFLMCACCKQLKPQHNQVEDKKTTTSTAGWGDAFKPKTGSWECPQCFIRNEPSLVICCACSAAKDPTNVKAASSAISDNGPKFNLGIPTQTNSQTTNATPANTVSSWGDKFKPKEGSWECKQCFVRNEGSIQQCSACSSPKDPNSKANSGSIFASSPEKLFSFGIPPNSMTNDKAFPTVKPSIFDGTAAQTFSFGIAQNAQDQTPSTPFTGAIFASPTPSTPTSGTPLNFSLNKDNANTKVAVKPALLSTPSTSTNKSTSGDQNSSFGFVFKPKTPPTKSPGKSLQSPKDDESDGYVSEDEGHHIHFNPVIPLPDKVEVVTGEENEIELYAHRAKLFIFTSGEWKERGIGVVKILKHKQTHKLRVVMRREQVLKICLNHSLTGEIAYSSKDNKTWLFAANDFSDGELNLQQFCLRFKTKEIAEEFKQAVDNARGGLAADGKKETTNGDDSSDNDVVFVSEKQASADDKKKAKDLMLPENFFNYKDKDPCQGCRGCNNEEDENTSLKPQELFKNVLSTATSTPVRLTPPVLSQASLVMGTPSSADKTFMGDTSIYRTPLGSTAFFNTKQSSPNDFTITSSNDTTDKENNAFQKINLFPTSQKSGFDSPQSSVFLSPQAMTSSNILKEGTNPKLENNGTTDAKSVFGLFTQKPSDRAQSTDAKSVFGSFKQKPLGAGNTDINTIFGSFTQKPSSETLNTEAKPLLGSFIQKPTDEIQSTDAKSVFGSFTPKPSGESQNTDVKPLFGSFTQKPLGESQSTNAKPVFGSFTQKSSGESQTTEAKPMFGSLTQKPSGEAQSTDAKSVFGSFTDKPSTGSIFGTNITGMKKPFTFSAETNKDQKPEMNPVFGSEAQNKSTNMFNSLASRSIFGTEGKSQAPGESIFGGSKFGVMTKPNSDLAKTESNSELKEPLFKVDNNLSFSALASGESSFQKNEDFKWEGEGEQLFGGVKNLAADNSGATGEDEYDPHYEPIVPLPDKIIVTTGEEDEEKIYGERCKLYRFDEKNVEWKERGVGELKILYHPEKKTYRLLLRREQIHKAVLNMLLHMDMELLPMKNSDRAWTWAGRNYAENPAGEQETLAVRFKSVALAQAYHEKATECIRKLQSLAAQALVEKSSSGGVALLRLPKHLQDNARADGDISQMIQQQTAQSTDALSNQQTCEEKEEEEEEDDEEYEYDEQNDGYDYDNEEEEESATYYTCTGSASVQPAGGPAESCERVLVQVSFDPEVYSPKILVTDHATGEILADMLIHTETEFQVSGATLSWSGTDFKSEDAREVTVTVTLPDEDTAITLYDSCETSKAATYSSIDPES